MRSACVADSHLFVGVLLSSDTEGEAVDNPHGGRKLAEGLVLRGEILLVVFPDFLNVAAKPGGLVVLRRRSEELE